ncbi:hypothetical protein HYH02_003732 [Chlamydomonas schloesseri]|uniref:Uncharacterized protein n=1 Tax=Chlamydomonas schloesseri TaxID=2026947 RepID=A0A836B9X6_9CHLO|nr:hypothetical protein HYH02_003732 [Chlamydomonas schloesseri]|eukprot:KAG2451958.1 hypothetical protein HYH02_003732 [Chlamydomonas schloesseri]
MHKATLERVLTQKTGSGFTPRWALVLGVKLNGDVQEYSAYVLTLAQDGGVKFKMPPSRRQDPQSDSIVMASSLAFLEFRSAKQATYFYNNDIELNDGEARTLAQMIYSANVDKLGSSGETGETVTLEVANCILTLALQKSKRVSTNKENKKQRKRERYEEPPPKRGSKRQETHDGAGPSMMTTTASSAATPVPSGNLVNTDMTALLPEDYVDTANNDIMYDNGLYTGGADPGLDPNMMWRPVYDKYSNPDLSNYQTSLLQSLINSQGAPPLPVDAVGRNVLLQRGKDLVQIQLELEAVLNAFGMSLGSGHHN